MATYKVIQDIEAEDKLLGPMTLRQFIYAVIVAVMGFVAFRLSLTAWYLTLPFLPPMVLFAVLAAPFGHDQPSEVWLLAKIRFALKPRRRIWDQSGLKELVTVTAPKREEKHYSDGLSQKEVKSRLRALADTIDSRGWAVKNVNVNMINQFAYDGQDTNSDRLVDPSSLPQEVPNYEVMPSDDMMDPQNNPAAQQLEQMMSASAQAHRRQVMAKMQQPDSQPQTTAGEPTNDYWFMHQPDPNALPSPGSAAFGTQTVLPQSEPLVNAGQPSADEQALLEKLRAQQQNFGGQYHHMKVINPLGQAPAPGGNPPAKPAATASPPPPDPAILDLAGNDDLNVATIAREAQRTRQKQPPKDEVVVSLH
jgi:hypothetical protein